MLFSVIIPTYNRRALLREALASVWAQTFTDYELIVVDDGSTDGTWEELQSLGSRVRAFRQQNAGPGAARNLGAKHAQGEYLAFLDSDDLWFPWTLETYFKTLAAHDNASVLRASIHDSSDAAPGQLFEVPTWKSYRDYYSASVDLPFLGAGMTVIKKSLFIEVGGFDPTLTVGEDHDFGMRAGILPGFVSILQPRTLAYHRREGTASDNLQIAVRTSFHILNTELEGKYPGGRQRERDRRRFLTGMIRPLVLGLIKQKKYGTAFDLYRRTVMMHFVMGRFRFLCAVPCMTVFHWLKPIDRKA